VSAGKGLAKAHRQQLLDEGFWQWLIDAEAKGT
jgi:hypothetical protein